MRRVFGPRTAIEAAFLVAVPVVSLVVGLGPYAIVAASAVGYLLVLLVEALLWRGRPPAPAPAPTPLAAVEPLPGPATVAPIGVGPEPRRWNLWDLERLSRERAGEDAVSDEERTFLLMYLREFAGPDGLLPVDFDGLVRDSFGVLVGAR